MLSEVGVVDGDRDKVFNHADGSRVSIAIIRVCDSVCVCVSVCVRQNGWKYSHQTWHRDSPSRYLTH